MSGNIGKSLMDKNCNCGGIFIYSKGSIDYLVGKNWYQYKILNYPHITCSCCGGVYHLNEHYKRLYEYMQSIGKENASSRDFWFYLDFNEYKSININ